MSAYKEIHRLKKRVNNMFWLLLFYSLLPGIYKVFDNQLLMLGSIPIIILLLKQAKEKIKINHYDAPFLFLVFYILLQSFFWFFQPIVNKIGLFMGIFMNVIPMAGYFISKIINIDTFSKVFLKIVLVHCVIGIILYPVFGIVDSSIPIIHRLTEGVAIGRMASVSGSLGFGNLLMIGFIISFFTDKKFLLPIGLCLIFSLQRSAWLGGAFAIFVYLIFLIKQANFSKLILLGVSFTLIISCSTFFLKMYIDLDLSYLTSRFQSVNTASVERFEQWVNGFHNFISYPLGTGSGQVGQIASRYDEAKSVFLKVPDGDYFRIISEYGLVGFLFNLYIIFAFIFSFFFRLGSKKNLLIIALIGGELIQMIGSNISEFYFTNFIYWIIIGYFFKFLNDNFTFNLKNKKEDDIRLHCNI